MRARAFVIVSIALLFLMALTARAETPLPPRFTVDEDVTDVLENYPLGVVDQPAVFSHHGKADRVVELPNGKTGWVYELGQPREQKRYTLPSGETRTVTERQRDRGRGTRTYTLVFDDGLVIDVLYNEQGRHDGLTALQLQQKSLEPGYGTDN